MPTLAQDAGKDQRLVVFGVPRGVQQRERTLGGEVCQRLERRLPLRRREFLVVALLELRPAFRVVAKPASQFSRRREVAQPGVEMRPLL